MLMKALSIKEPNASKIRKGEKTIETRTWATKYRGPILLCASLKPKSPISGYAFAVADLVDCRPMTREHETAAACDLYNGAYSWFLGKIVPVTIFPVKGKLGLFNVDVTLDYYTGTR